MVQGLAKCGRIGSIRRGGKMDRARLIPYSTFRQLVEGSLASLPLITLQTPDRKFGEKKQLLGRVTPNQPFIFVGNDFFNCGS